MTAVMSRLVIVELLAPTAPVAAWMTSNEPLEERTAGAPLCEVTVPLTVMPAGVVKFESPAVPYRARIMSWAYAAVPAAVLAVVVAFAVAVVDVSISPPAVPQIPEYARITPDESLAPLPPAHEKLYEAASPAVATLV
jgi:hypothetical protein